MSQASRFFANQDSVSRAKSQLWGAQSALDRFRRNGDPSGFPELREYLLDKHGKYGHSMDLSGWGPDRHGLTEEEYLRFKAAYMATDAGVQDDWTNWRNPDDKFW